MIVTIPSVPPARPRNDEVKVGLPVRARTLRRLAYSALHAALRKCARHGSCPFEYDQTTPLEEQSPQGISDTHYVYLEPDLLAQYLWTSIRYQATRDSGGSPPSLTVRLCKTDGTVIDPGWTITSALLAGEEFEGFPIRRMQSSFAWRETPASPTAPSLLNFDELDTCLALEIDVENVRVVSVDYVVIPPLTVEIADD